MAVLLLVLLLAPALLAQPRVWESNGEVFFQDAQGTQSNLGPGRDPHLTPDGEIAILRGPKVDYGDPFDCAKKKSKNWVALYNPATESEKPLFDQPLPFNRDMLFCIYDQMQLSPNGTLLYLVAPVYATSGSLAIIKFPGAQVHYVPGVNSVYIIQTGHHRGELIYQARRMNRRSTGWEVSYPWIHARANGRPIDTVPDLSQYLRKRKGSITMYGKTIP